MLASRWLSGRIRRQRPHICCVTPGGPHLPAARRGQAIRRSRVREARPPEWWGAACDV